MKKLIKSVPVWAYGIVAGVIALFPEFTLDKFGWFECLCDYFDCIDKWIWIIICKMLFFLIICAITTLIALLYKKHVVTRELTFDNSGVIIKDGDLFEEAKRGVAIVSFDECFTCDVGVSRPQINPTSICGQFINKHPDIGEFIKNKMSEVLPSKKSLYNNLPAYEPGVLFSYDDDSYLLLAFAKLDEHGSAVTTRKEYITSLLNIWQNINFMYAQRDVYVPIFGSGTLRFIDGDMSQQQLLDIMLMTYEMTPNKIKAPNKLFIIYKPKINFSVWNIRTC